MVNNGENLQVCGKCGGHYLLTDIAQALPDGPEPSMVYEVECETCGHNEEIQCWSLMVAAAYDDAEMHTDKVRAMFAKWGLDYDTERSIFMPRIRKARCNICQDTKIGQRWDADEMKMVSAENSCPQCCGALKAAENDTEADVLADLGYPALAAVGQPMMAPFGENAVDAVMAVGAVAR